MQVRAQATVALFVVLSANALGAQGPWTVTIRQTSNPLPIGTCHTVSLTVYDPATKGNARNGSGGYVSAADFDMSVESDGNAAAVGKYEGTIWSACACQSATVGQRGTITATYPGKSIKAGSGVAGVAFKSQVPFTFSEPQSKYNAAGCDALKNAAVSPARPLAALPPKLPPVTLAPAPAPAPPAAVALPPTLPPVTLAPAPAPAPPTAVALPPTLPPVTLAPVPAPAPPAAVALPPTLPPVTVAPAPAPAPPSAVALPPTLPVTLAPAPTPAPAPASVTASTPSSTSTLTGASPPGVVAAPSGGATAVSAPAPTGLSINGRQPLVAHLTWNAVTGAQRYIVRRSTGTSSPDGANTFGISVRSSDDTLPSPELKYIYTVEAQYANGRTGQSPPPWRSPRFPMTNPTGLQATSTLLQRWRCTSPCLEPQHAW